VCGQDVQFLNVEPVSASNNQKVLKVKMECFSLCYDKLIIVWQNVTPVIAEDRIRYLSSPCGTGTGFFPSTSVFPHVSIIPPMLDTNILFVYSHTVEVTVVSNCTVILWFV
jgi:hypothetical protein